MAIGTERDEVLDAVILALAPRPDMRPLERSRLAADGAAVPRFKQDLPLNFNGNGGAVRHQ
jgi:hypothetical protein